MAGGVRGALGNWVTMLNSGRRMPERGDSEASSYMPYRNG